MGEFERAERYARMLSERAPGPWEIGLVLGSGLGGFAERMENARAVDYGTLPGFPVSTVPGHRGRFVFGEIAGHRLCVMQGRIHYYEGHPMADVVLPIRVMGRLGVRTVLLTNAAGGISKGFAPGTLMLIKDHIASFVPSPLRGENEEGFGPRFPDLTEAYDPALREKAKAAAVAQGIALSEGVYLQAPGPAYETPAEVRLYGALGADAVGMSTACETVAARHMGLSVCGISCITNPAAGISPTPLSHEEVQAAAARASGDFARLLTALIAAL